MTDLVEPTSDRPMTDEERELADQVYEAVMASATTSERSQQQADFRLGISDLGFCSERVRRMIAGIPEPPTDKLAAFIGTAIGDHVEQAVQRVFPRTIRQAKVQVQINGAGGLYTLTGHPDLIDPTGRIIDFKTTRGLTVVQRTGPSQQQQFQRHLYALGAHREGWFDSGVTLEEVQVANIWFDRAADEKRCYVHMEPYSPDVITQAGFWIDDVVYAYLHGEEARKEPPREMCYRICGHAFDCRGTDTDVEGLITDPEILTAVDLHMEAAAMSREADRLKSEAKSYLTGVSGSTGKFMIRWVHVNGAHVEFDRKPSDRLEIRPVR